MFSICFFTIRSKVSKFSGMVLNLEGSVLSIEQSRNGKNRWKLNARKKDENDSSPEKESFQKFRQTTKLSVCISF